MIDIHSHILPNIDDGSKSIEQSINMAKEAEAAGFKAICCTPHYLEEKYIKNKFNNTKVLENLQEELKRNNINIELYIGNEIYITDEIEDLIKMGQISTLNNRKYILVELPMNYPIASLETIIFKIQNLNLIPIIAHPERYAYVQKDPNFLIGLIEKGVLFQGNYASLIGYYGKDVENTIKILLKNNMIHMLGSDTHRDNSIYSNFDKIKKILSKCIDDELIDELTNINPKKVIENDEIDVYVPIEYKKKKWFF